MARGGASVLLHVVAHIQHSTYFESVKTQNLHKYRFQQCHDALEITHGNFSLILLLSRFYVHTKCTIRQFQFENMKVYAYSFCHFCAESRVLLCALPIMIYFARTMTRFNFKHDGINQDCQWVRDVFEGTRQEVNGSCIRMHMIQNKCCI